jgi:hypothetical protein
MTEDFVDAYNVVEFFCERLHGITPVGSCRRLMFTIHQMEGSRRISIGVVKLVLPAEALADIAQMLAADCQSGSSVLVSLPTAARALAN